MRKKVVYHCFFAFDYWLIREPFYPKMGKRRFLNAFLFSQLAYLGYLYRLKQHICGIHAFADGVFFFLIDIPMFILCFPLSAYLFNKRINKLMNSQLAENELDSQKDWKEKNDDRKFIIDYLIFWSISFVSAVLSYWLNYYR